MPKEKKPAPSKKAEEKVTKKVEEPIEQDPENYVGPKTVVVSFLDGVAPVPVTFPTSIAYNRAIRQITETVEGLVEVKRGENRMVFDPASVEAVIFPPEELTLRKLSKWVVLLQLIFRGGLEYVIPIAGENRMRLMYKKLHEFLMKDPADDPQFIRISQEENKYAYVLHHKVLIGMRVEYPEGHKSEVLDGNK